MGVQVVSVEGWGIVGKTLAEICCCCFYSTCIYSDSVCLKAMRKGLLDVLPKNALEDLTAEDFRLLVNGCGEVNVQMLISFTSFNDESGL